MRVPRIIIAISEEKSPVEEFLAISVCVCEFTSNCAY